MPEDNATNPPKKHRVIHWNPEANEAPVGRRWTWKRIVGWSVGGFLVLLFSAGIVIRVIKYVAGPDVFKPRAELVGADGLPLKDDPNAVFVTQSKAEFAFESA